MPNNVGSSLGGSSLVLYSQQNSFDVGVEADVISLLKIVHQNPLDAEVKNHLRDLIFAYKQEETDASQKAIVDAFAQLGVSVVAPSKQSAQVTISTPSEKKSTFGMGRPQPAFKAVIAQPQVKSVVTEVIPATGVAPTPTQAQKIVELTVAPSTPAPGQTIPVVEPVMVKPEPAAIPTAVPVAEPTPVPFVNPNQRINEIKSIVNQKVGNPVNLIDAHNEIGREYMNALLDAMKKANGGQQGDVATSMARLEKAFLEVTRALHADGTQKISSLSTSSDTVSIQISTVAAPIVEIPVVQNVQAEQTKITPVAAPPVQRVVVPPPVFTENNSARVAVPAPSSQTTVRPSIVASNEVPKIQEVAPPPVALRPQSPHTGLHSVAYDKEQQDGRRAVQEKTFRESAEAEKKRITELDPLLTPAVTSGLGQLLSEWGLFKSSGIFGTGPSGKDHPLYQKLAPLTMAAVIAGRFEGVTPQIKQSITDYMNGWRYEEEIIHEHAETFEHYLRRVIYHILNKSKLGSK